MVDRIARVCFGAGAALVVLMVARGQAQDFTYTTTNSSIIITGSAIPNGFVGSVSIPSAINGLPVVSIRGGAFVTNLYLTSITIPSTITNIGNEAFEQCLALTNVVFAEGLTTIGDYAFATCIDLVGLTIPSSVTSIGIGAFMMPPPGYFSHTALLTNVVFKGNAPSLGPNGDLSLLFEGCLGVTIYYLPGTMGWGATFGERPAKLWNPQVQTQDASFGVRQNGFGFNISGTSDIPILVEGSTGPVGQPWVPLQTCTLTNGSIYFDDPQWTNYPGRFYRIRSP